MIKQYAGIGIYCILELEKVECSIKCAKQRVK